LRLTGGSDGSADCALAKDCRSVSIAPVRPNLFGQLLCIGMLRGDQALETLQLILHGLQLVDGFLLRRLEALGLLKELLGRLGGAGLPSGGATSSVPVQGSYPYRRATTRPNPPQAPRE